MRAQVQSLIGELRSHKPQGMAKTQNKTKNKKQRNKKKTEKNRQDLEFIKEFLDLTPKVGYIKGKN